MSLLIIMSTVEANNATQMVVNVWKNQLRCLFTRTKYDPVEADLSVPWSEVEDMIDMNTLATKCIIPWAYKAALEVIASPIPPLHLLQFSNIPSRSRRHLIPKHQKQAITDYPLPFTHSNRNHARIQTLRNLQARILRRLLSTPPNLRRLPGRP